MDLNQSERSRLLGSYAKAFETADASVMPAILAADVSWEMPPNRDWLAGRSAVIAFLAERMRSMGAMRTIPAAANGQPALGLYTHYRDDTYHPHEFHVLTITPTIISRIVAFQDPRLFPLFSLPGEISDGPVTEKSDRRI